MDTRQQVAGLLALLLALTVLLAIGCAGEGLPGDGIEPDPPDDTSGGSIPCVKIPGGTSYLSRVLLDGTDVLRFTKAVVTVSMNTAEVPAGWRSGYVDYVREAMSKWQSAGRGAYSFREATSSDADISISWVDSLGGYTTGITEHVIVGNRFFPPNTRIALRADGSRLREEDIRITTIHEFGHALGLMGHSVNTRDVMFVSASVVDLSPNDRQTLADLYCHTADITQVQVRGTAIPEGARVIVQERQRDGSCCVRSIE